MAQQISVTFEMPDDMLLALGHAALAAGGPPSHYLLAVLRAALGKTAARMHPEDEGVRLALALATDWPDLQQRLRGLGLVLRRTAGKDLVLHSWPLERPVLGLSALGISEAALVLRFATAFPPAGRATLPARLTPSRRAA